MWQLYDTSYRPKLKYGIGKLTWVSLTVSKTCFVYRSRQLIDWATDGTMEVSDAAFINRMFDAKTEFHYQLLNPEHRSFYDEHDLEILDDCLTIANDVWLKNLTGRVTSSKRRPHTISKSSLVAKHMSKAYTRAFPGIKAILFFNQGPMADRPSTN